MSLSDYNVKNIKQTGDEHRTYILWHNKNQVQ